jgi:hypothetical protein
VIALIALFAAAYHIVDKGWDVGKTSLIFPGIAGAWYMTRRGMRKKIFAHTEDGSTSE